MQHRFNVSPKEAVQIQQELRAQVRLVPLTAELRVIGGCDVSMNRFAKDGYAGFVSLDALTLEPVATASVRNRIPFPYVPGLLSFREIPMLMKAWETLSVKPDVLVVDGIGVAHPRRFGIASHLGVLLGIPTIGCAKSVLVGTYEMPADEPGAHTNLVDPKSSEVIGAALRTKRKAKPVFVSPGHLITHAEAVEVVIRAVRKHRLPEPTRLAHHLVNAHRVNDLPR